MVVPGGEGSLESMKYAGRNGIALVLVALCWWYMHAGGVDNEGPWMEVLKSIYSTMCTIMSDFRYVSLLACNLPVTKFLWYKKPISPAAVRQ
jgi:hypothetical protein